MHTEREDRERRTKRKLDEVPTPSSPTPQSPERAIQPPVSHTPTPSPPFIQILSSPPLPPLSSLLKPQFLPVPPIIHLTPIEPTLEPSPVPLEPLVEPATSSVRKERESLLQTPPALMASPPTSDQADEEDWELQMMKIMRQAKESQKTTAKKNEALQQENAQLQSSLDGMKSEISELKRRMAVMEAELQKERNDHILTKQALQLSVYSHPTKNE